MVDILYLAHGRREFTQASLKALRENTQLGWPHARLWVYTDGHPPADEFADAFSLDLRRYGGPVACMRQFVASSGSELIAKIDNDVMLPPDWLPECISIMDSARNVDLLGIEPWTPDRSLFPAFENPQRGSACPYPVSHIGGIGVFRRSAFEKYGLPKPNSADGRYGFTEWQWANPQMGKAFLSSPLPVFLLDHLPLEPWRSLSAKYEAEGIQRRQWGFYDAEEHKGLWEWWRP